MCRERPKDEGAQADALAQGPEDVRRAPLVGLDHGLLDVVVHVGLLGRHEHGAAVDALGAERDRRSETAPVADAARGDVGRLDLAGREGELRCAGGGERLGGEESLRGRRKTAHQEQATDVVLTRVSRALEAVDGEEVDADLLGGLGVTDARALVDDSQAVLLEVLDDGDRSGTTSRLGNLDPFLDDDLGVLVVRRGRDRGQEGEVDAAACGRRFGSAAALKVKTGEQRTRACWSACAPRGSRHAAARGSQPSGPSRGRVRQRWKRRRRAWAGRPTCARCA